MDTVWVLGDQLHREQAALAGRRPGDVRVLLVESEAKLASKAWHRQRAHLVLTAMRRFAAELADEGFEVDHRRAPSLAAGLAAHRAEHRPPQVLAMEPMSWSGRRLLEREGVAIVRSNQFLCHYDEFATWAGDRRRLKMEDFYRWMRRRTGYLMEGDEPCGGRWNYDADNREPPPKDGRAWPAPVRTPLDDTDRAVLADLPGHLVGADPDGLWATSRTEALRRLDRAIDEVLPVFGPHEDAILEGSWHLAHATLSHALNLGLLTPHEVCDAIDDAYRAGRVPIASAEGMLRQVLGWREYVWGVYWRWMPGYRHENALGAHRPVPPALRPWETGARTRMRCVAHAIDGLEARGYLHHIQRLMVLSNLALLAGVDPQAMNDWMWRSFVDGAEWVMLPNVIGMGLHADGGRMATKPYAGGGAYINRMSDHCRGCEYDPRRRTGVDACPFTTLYWDFLARHEDRFARNPRMRNQIAALRRLDDLDAVRAQAVDTLTALDAGTL